MRQHCAIWWLMTGVVALGACGGSDGPSGPSGGRGLTVAGHVVNACGQPLPNATVWISGKGVLTANASGAFTASGVTTPYDIAVIVRRDTTFLAVYQGVTRSDPRVASFDIGALRKATVQGTVTENPTVTVTGATGLFRNVGFLSGDVDYSLATNDQPYSISPAWCGPTSTVGVVNELEVFTAANGPVGYAYGKLEGVTLADASTASNRDFTVAQTATGIVSGTASLLNPSYVSSGTTLLLDFGASARLGMASYFFNENQPTSTFAFTVPDIPGVDLVVVENGRDAAGRTTSEYKRGIRPNTTDLSFSLPPAAALSTPADASSGIDLATQSFTWTPSPAGLHMLYMVAPQLQAEVITAGSSVTMPSSTELNVQAPESGTQLFWAVFGFTGSSADALLDPGAPTHLNRGLLIPEPGSDFTVTLSEARSFVAK